VEFMAKNKSGFKKKSEDRFISYILIGFSVVFFVIILSIVLYNVLAQPLDYDSFETIENFSLVNQMPESEYLVYYYTEDCTFCKQIKTAVLEFADDNNAGIKVYFIDGYNVTGINTVPGMEGTPSLVTVRNGVVVNLVAGAVDIPNTFDEINAGTYGYLN